MALLAYPFLAVSALGFAALFAIHVASLFGATYPFEHLFGFIAPGMFVVALPTILS